uniref:Uncharacterized protein n=1 Tax=Panagrolaimus superbus TaxID=310955 RepID=A0A914Z0Q8_9BILA
MSYSAFRKKASTLERPPHTSSSSTTTHLSDHHNSTSESTTQQHQLQHLQEQRQKEEQKEIETTSEKMIERTIESTTGVTPTPAPTTTTAMRQTRFGRKREDSSWQRPRSMFAMISSSSTSNNNNNNNNKSEEEKEKNDGGDNNKNIKDKEKESFANVSVASTARKLLDTSTFSQITPPPMSRKFATLQKTPPKPLPRSIYSSSDQQPLFSPPPSSSTLRSLSASSSALHDQHQHQHQHQHQQQHSSISTTRTGFASRPPAQFAKFDSPIQLQNAKVYAPIQNSPKLAQSSSSAFTAPAISKSLKPGSTPPTKPRGNISSCPSTLQPQHQQQKPRTFIVPILASAKEIIPPRHHRIGIASGTNENSAASASIHLAQPASAVLSRQQSYETNSTNSPLEIRKMFISTPHTISRYGGASSATSTSSTINGQNVNRYTFEKSSSASQQQQHQQKQCSMPLSHPHLQSSSSTSRNRREKIWHESEGL